MYLPATFSACKLVYVKYNNSFKVTTIKIKLKTIKYGKANKKKQSIVKNNE